MPKNKGLVVLMCTSAQLCYLQQYCTCKGGSAELKGQHLLIVEPEKPTSILFGSQRSKKIRGGQWARYQKFCAVSSTVVPAKVVVCHLQISNFSCGSILLNKA